MAAHSVLTQMKIVSVATTLAGSTFQISTNVDADFIQADAVDTLGYEGVAFGYKIGAGTNAAVVATKLQDCDTANGSFADIAGSLTTVTDVGGNKLNRWIWTEVIRPRKRFISPLYKRTIQNSALDTIVAILFRSFPQAPVTQSTALGGVAATFKHLVGPAEGTA